jgi:hypothetical protein
MADSSTYVQGDVYREQNTGKFRVKGTTKIEQTSESPASLTEVETKLNAVLQLLEDFGINADTD